MKSEIDPILNLVDQAYDRKAWHGPNLRGAIRRLTATEAAWRPAPSRRSIAEHVLHAAYWKYTVRRRLNDEKRGSFDLKGSNWFPIDETHYPETAWKADVALLDRVHQTLRQAIASLPLQRLDTVPAGSKVTVRELIHGIALHDVYHAGQISLLKRLRA